MTSQTTIAASAAAQGNVTLNWTQPVAPIFTVHPQSQTVHQVDNVTFTSTAIDTPNPTDQWRFNGANISGATGTSYSLTNVQSSDAANYTVVAENISGSVTSIVATLTVYPSATPTLEQTVVSGDEFRFLVSGITNFNYVVQANTNLSTTNWVALATNPAPFTFTNVITTNNPQRFFREVYQS